MSLPSVDLDLTGRHRPRSEWTRAEEPPDGRGVVVQYSNGDVEPAKHQAASLAFIAEALAKLKRYDYAGEYNAASDYTGRLYFVPLDTIVGIAAARELGIAGANDLFGGVVPYPFVATKTITHPLVHPNASAPQGWSDNFARRVQHAVLFGFSAFTLDDALAAGARLLERGPARLKPARGVGGRGQKVVSSLGELDRELARIRPVEELSRYGIVIEENLEEVTTYSVGQVTVDNLLLTYCGTQLLTSDHIGASVYGGSDLVVVRGGFEKLLKHDLTPGLRLAVAQARSYDLAAAEEFRRLFASRRNYDVAQGFDSAGKRVSGVLEQSWRIGGASPAELAALEAFRADEKLRSVRSSCIEIHDANHEPPSGAIVHFRGEDDQLGSIVKYTLVDAYANSR